jgi:hypothetical protein
MTGTSRRSSESLLRFVVSVAEKKVILGGKLEELEEEISKTKDNKKTNKHIRILRAKIAKVKREIVIASKKVHGEGFFVKKTGDATVALVGFPSAGKSSLINAIANTRSKTAQYAFTTTTIIPGTMIYKDAHIQIFDMPGLIEDAHLGVGGGRMVIAAMKPADLLVFVIDINIMEQFDKLINEFKQLKVHMNEKKPSLQIVSQVVGGLKIEVNKSGLPDEDVETILIGLGIHNANVSIWDKVDEDSFIDIVTNKSRYMKAIVVLNKIDTKNDYQKITNDFSKKQNIKTIPVSATEGTNIALFKDAIYDTLGIITVYLKPKLEDEGHAMILKKGATVGDAARKFHTEIFDELKCAYVKGPSVRFLNQRVGVTHELKEGDTITFIKNK